MNHLWSRYSWRIAALTVLVGCRAAVPPWGSGLEEAKRNADNALRAYSVRFTNVRRDSFFEHARPLLGRHALTPAALFRDSTIWTIQQAPDSSKALYLDAGFDGRNYLFSARNNAAYPTTLGGQRHYIRLQKLPGDNYEWVTIVDHAIGTATPEQFGAAILGVLTGFEKRTSAELLADMRSNFSRTARHMAQLFRIDSLRTTPHDDGSTSLVMGVSFVPDSLKRTYPAFAAYVDKYVVPTIHRTQLFDRTGARYFDMGGGPGRFVVRLRAHRGRLVSLTGPPKPMPDTLRARFDFSARFKIFRVGFSELMADFILTRSPHERGWFLRFQQEPKWRLPLAVNHLIKNPLKTPFSGRGTEMRLLIRDDLADQTISLRHMRTVVNESAIMRWMGSLGGTAFGDFEGTSEVEENRYLMQMFEALRADVASLGG